MSVREAGLGLECSSVAPHWRARSGRRARTVAGAAGSRDVGEHGRRLAEGAAGDRPREDDAVGVHAEAHEARHRDAPVLELGVAQPADRALLAEVKEVEAGEAERVPEAEAREASLVLELGEVLDGLHDRRDRARGRRARQRHGREADGGVGESEHLECG